MKLMWFKRNGMIFLPASLIGWIILLGGFIYSVYSFISIDSRSHSVSDTLMNFVFRLLIIVAVYSLIACITSRPSDSR
jgi:membrane protein DedA with SNARE-associated domain